MEDNVLRLRPALAPGNRAPVDLATTAPFPLGRLQIVPPHREIVAPEGARQALEPRVMQVLVALARADGGIVTRDELIASCWGGTVVGEDSITRTISMLRRIAAESGADAFRIETITKIGYRLVVPGNAQAPDAADAATEPSFAQPEAWAPSRRVVWAAAAVLLVVLVGGFAAWRVAPTGPTYSVSVAPFRTSGGATGFDDELASALTSLDVPTAGGQVALVLTGSVEHRQGTTRINARLVDPASDDVVWSGAEQVPSAAPGTLAATAVRLGYVAQCTLKGANDAGRQLAPALLSRFARACGVMNLGDAERGLEAARQLARQAPDFAGSWFVLANLSLKVGNRRPGEGLAERREALAAAEKLIALRPEAQEGYAYKAMAMDARRPVERERLLRRAVALKPIWVNSAPGFLGDFLMQVGRLEEAYEVYAAAMQTEPDAMPYHLRVFFAARTTDRERVAAEEQRRVEQLEPGNASLLQFFRHRRATWRGDWAEAARQSTFEHAGHIAAATAAYGALASGDRAAKDAAAAQLVALADGCCIYPRIEQLTLLGQTREAIALLEQYDPVSTPGNRPGNAGLFLWDPAVRPLWYDPAIEPFLERHGWIAYWRASKSRPDICGKPGPPRFCARLS